MVKIGLTLSLEKRGEIYEYGIPSDYIRAVTECGALPVLLPPVDNCNILNEYLSGVDGIIMTGGDDISPVLYGEINTGLSRNVSEQRDRSELYLLKKAISKHYPVLGICRGFQLINVYFGGTLYQDLSMEFNGIENHANVFKNPEDLHHDILIEKGSFLFDIIGTSDFKVNSRHHQGVKNPGKGLVCSAYSGDGIIEALEQPDMNIIAVQWHPENLVCLGRRYKSLFIDLIKRCELFREKV